MPARHSSPFTRLAIMLAVALVACLALAGTALAAPQDDLRQANRHVDAALAALDRGDIAGAQTEYAAFDDAWFSIEDGIRDTDRGAYRNIEAAMLDVKVAFSTQPVDPAAARTALLALRDTNARFIQGEVAATNGPAGATEPATDAERLQQLQAHLEAARAGIAAHDSAAALGAVKAFQADWPAIEGAVRTKSSAAYTDTENDMALAQALLASQPPQTVEADAVLARMHERLAPIVAGGGNYGVFDAFIIMLREGLEALLVIGALLAFLKKSGNEDKRRWIWAGAGAGVALSVVLAVILQQVFSRAGASLGSEMVEGITGLVAAAMLFYVSYWLHSKSQLGAWQRYIRDKSTSALARGSMASLATIALLSVFREGAETAVFYLGIAPSIAIHDLALGVGLGVAALAVIGVVLLALGQRLPLRPFFLASSVLIYYLGFKFVGTGLHALQVAGVIGATPIPLPSVDSFGVYPTLETALPQLALLALAGLVLWLTVRQARHAHAATSTASA